MTSQITIIGLGQIGTSIGLALKSGKDKLLRVGHDKSITIAKDARKLGAIDKVHHNLPNSVREADIIILSLPFSEIRDTLKYIAQDLKEDALILDTGTSKAAVYSWVQELLPAGQTYIGLVPVIKAAYLLTEEFGINAARADLFQETIMMMAVPAATSEEHLNTAAALIDMLGAQPIFTDLYEADGVIASAHLLPQLTALTLLQSTVKNAGWAETRKIAGRAFAEATRPILHQEGAASLTEALFANPALIRLKLDQLMASIQHVKTLLDAEDKEALEKTIETLQENRRAWQVERSVANPADDQDESGQQKSSFTAQLFGYKQRKWKK